MQLRSVDELNVANKKVFVRIDIDCGNPGNKEQLDLMLSNSIPTLKFLLENEAKVIVGTHIGNTAVKSKNSISLESVGLILSEILSKDVYFIDSIYNDACKKLFMDLPPGSLILLENLAFYNEEKDNSEEFARFLADKIDIYVNEAFSKSECSFASLVSVPGFMERENIVVGLNFKNEIEELMKIKGVIERPSVLFLSGRNVRKKIELATEIIDEIDYVVLTGEVANTHSKVLKSSFTGEYEDDAYSPVKNFISSAKTRNLEIIKFNTNKKGTRFDMPANDVEYLLNIVSGASTVIWVGNIKASDDLNNTLNTCSGYKFALGKDAQISLINSSMVECFDFISTAGDISLDFITGNQLKVLDKLLNI